MPDLRSADVLRTAGTFAVFEGVLFIVGGLLLVISPFASVVALTQVTGVLLLIAGVVGVIRTAGAPHHEHGGGTGIVGSVLAAIAGVVLLLDPTLSAAFIVSVLGAMLLVSGGMQIAAACGMHGRDQWGLVLLSGILTTLLGAVVFLLPNVAILVFAVFAGVQLVFLGVMLVRGGSEFRRVARTS